MRNHLQKCYSLLYFKHILETTTFCYTFHCVFVKFTIGFLRSFSVHLRTLQNIINMTIILDTVNNVWCKAFTVTVYNGAFSGHWSYQCEVSICISITTQHWGGNLCLVKHVLEGGAVWSCGTWKKKSQFSWGHQNKLIFVTEPLDTSQGAQVGTISFLHVMEREAVFETCLKEIQDKGQHLKSHLF